MAVEPKLLGGRFSDRGRAQDAFDLLMGAPDTPADLDVAFYGSDGEYVLLVAAKDSDAESWAAQVLRTHGATVQERRFIEWLSRSRNELVHQPGGSGDRRSEKKGALRTHWATMAILLMQQGLLEPADLLVLLLTTRRVPDTLPGDEKRWRLREADEELREVAEDLEAELRARHPELFDRRGRLRTAALARHLSERAGGKEVLSGDELRVLEDSADTAARSGRAP